MIDPARTKANRAVSALAWTALLWPSLVLAGEPTRPRPTSAPATAERPLVESVDAIGMTVGDLDRSVEFFTNVLTFEKLDQRERTGPSLDRLTGLTGVRQRIARLRLGQETIELTEYASPHGRPFPPDTRGNDRWFQHIAIIVRDMDRAYARLQERGVTAASRNGPQRLPDWNRSAAGIRAFYFRDPDGHFLEVLQFPPGKGDPRWHAPTDRLFLGIDHTAIVVADTQRSLRFYCDELGLRVAGGSENYGPEQENLNNVPGAHLRITTLRAARGPAIEFLEYLSPRDGRPYPGDARACDLLHWQTTLVTRGPPRAFLTRDPDGHAMRFIQNEATGSQP